MKNARVSNVLLLLGGLAVSACSAPEPSASESSVETTTPTVVTTATQASTTTEVVEPSTTAPPALLALEIVEWNEYPYANLADPQNTDTHVEILVRNPNDFPVKLNSDGGDELRFVNATGENVYTNPNPVFYFWDGSWILGGETSSMSACVCFWTDGVEEQEWTSLELVVPLEPATEFTYTTDVDATIGEFFNLSEAHLGGDEWATELTLVNASTQVLRSFAVRVVARDSSGAYVGVAIYGSFVADLTDPEAPIEPGASGGGLVVTEIDYVDEAALVYEVLAIGIPAQN